MRRGRRRLHASWKNCFGRGSIDEFALSSIDLGELEAIHVGHDSPSLNSGWFLDRVVVSDSTGRHWEFVCGRWLDKHEDNGVTDLTLRGRRVGVEESGGGGGASAEGSGASGRGPLAPRRGNGSGNRRRRCVLPCRSASERRAFDGLMAGAFV